LRPLAGATWPETQGARLVLVPIGSIEQHGPHLPLDTDSAIADAVARGVAEVLPDAWVAPPVVYGASGEHQGFPGTVSIGTYVLHQVVVELVRSLRSWADRVVLVNGHGGNLAALRTSVDLLTREGHDVTWVPCATARQIDLHAGRTETSLMLHLRPEHVRLDRIEVGNTAPWAEVAPTMFLHGVLAVSPNGVLGDPRGATAAEGAELLASMVGGIVRQLAVPVSA
jgi:creatinine amidohydrolase